MNIPDTTAEVAKNTQTSRRSHLEPLTGILLDFADALDCGDLVAAERLCAQAEEMAMSPRRHLGEEVVS